MSSLTSKSEVLYTLSGYKLGETDKAVRFNVHKMSGSPVPEPYTQWFPLSQIRKMKTIPPGHPDSDKEMDEIIVTEWILRQKGIV